MEKEEVIIADNISFIYDSTEIKALNKLSFKINGGDFILLCGPTGSGKTSLIRSINGLIPHFYHGQFYGYLKINNNDTVESSPIKLAKFVGSVFQNPDNQLFAFNVERELTFALENLGFPREIIKTRIEKVIKLIGLENLRNRIPFSLSSGEKQKVAIASILTLNPDTIILDEPLANLDPKTAKEVIQLLCDLNQKERKTIIIAEHRLEYIIPYVQKIMLIADGKISNFASCISILNNKQIYSLGIDLPPLLYWFFDQIDNQQLNFSISNQLKEHANLFNILLESKNMLPLSPTNMYYNFNRYEKNNPILSLSNIFFSYPETSNSQFSIKNLNFHIFAGEIFGLLGPNGAGKTTLINLILGLIQPSEGTIYFSNTDITNFSVQKRAKKIGVIFQNPDHQLFSKTVYAEMEFSLKNLNLTKIEIDLRIETYLKQFNLWNLKDSSPFSLSGGQKRKVAIISIIIREPEIIIFDEPTVGLDAIEKKLLEDFILKMQQNGRTVIIISHDINFISQIATRVCIVKEGQIYADGSLKTILSDTNLIESCSLEQSHFLQVKKQINGHKQEDLEQIINIKQLKEIWP